MSNPFKRSLLDRLLRRKKPNKIERFYEKVVAKGLLDDSQEDEEDPPASLPPSRSRSRSRSKPVASHRTHRHSRNEPNHTILQVPPTTVQSIDYISQSVPGSSDTMNTEIQSLTNSSKDRPTSESFLAVCPANSKGKGKSRSPSSSKHHKRKHAIEKNQQNKKDWKDTLLPEPFVPFDPFKESPLFAYDPSVETTLGSAAHAMIKDTATTSDGPKSIRLIESQAKNRVSLVDPLVQTSDITPEPKTTTGLNHEKKRNYVEKREHIHTRLYTIIHRAPAQDTLELGQQSDQESKKCNKTNEKIKRVETPDLINGKEHTDGLADKLFDQRLPSSCLVRESKNSIQFTFRKPKNGKLLRFACWAEPFSLEPLGPNHDAFELYESDSDAPSNSNGSDNKGAQARLGGTDCQACNRTIENRVSMTIDNKSPDAKGSLDKKSYYTAIEYLPLHQEPQGRAKSTDREADQQSKLCHDPNTIMNDFQSRYLGVNHPLNDFHGNFWTEDSRPDSTNGTIPDIGLCSIVARGNNEILGRKQMGPNDDMIINGHSGEEVRRDPGGQSDRRSSLLGFYDKEMYDIPQDPSSSRWYLDPLYWDI